MYTTHSHVNTCTHTLSHACTHILSLSLSLSHACTHTHTHSPLDVKELEKAVVNMVRSENADIKQKQDPARLAIQHCQLVIVNTHAPMVHPSEIKDSPLTQVRQLHLSHPPSYTLSASHLCISLAHTPSVTVPYPSSLHLPSHTASVSQHHSLPNLTVSQPHSLPNLTVSQPHSLPASLSPSLTVS